jgi:outer membrane protein OmpA-like peptidoglycan-associated protein
LERYESATAGSPLFLADRPWYAPRGRIAAALTLGYAHRSLALTDNGITLPAIVDHSLTAWLDVAGSPLSFLLLRGSLPVTVLERGVTDPQAGIAPVDGAAIGDPRLGAVLALWRRPDLHPISVHVALDAWLPAGTAYASHQGDANARFLPRAILAGTLRRSLRWTLDAGFLYRADAVLGTGSRTVVAGSEVQAAAALGYVTAAARLHLALEGRFAARVTQRGSPSGDALRGQLLASAQYQLGAWLQLGGAVGSDFATPGSPDLRVLLRVALSPQRLVSDPASAQEGAQLAESGSVAQSRKSPQASTGTSGITAAPGAAGPAAHSPVFRGDDADRDGVPDDADRCPYEPETANGIRDEDGCPESPLALQAARALRFKSPAASPAAAAAPDSAAPRAQSAGATEASAASGAGAAAAAASPATSSARSDGPAAAAAPLAVGKEDSDQDGVPDEEDRCPISAEDQDQFEDDDGCPDPDNDEDGILDAQDRCPLEAETQNAYQDDDGCPDVAPATAPQVQVSAAGDRIEVNLQVQFKRRQAEIDPTSFPLLRAVASILRSHPRAALEVQGHTDAGGDPQSNQALSQQRAESVRAFLIKEGIAAERLQARGYGASQPRFPNTTADGRARNRRVEFVLQGEAK